MTNEKPTNPSHGELTNEQLLNEWANSILHPSLGRKELRFLILGKMGEGEKEPAAILRFDGEGDEWFIPAEPGPLGPFPFVEAVKEFMAFMDREFSKLDATVSRLQSELEEARKENARQFKLYEHWRDCALAAEARLAAQVDVRGLGKLLWLSVEKEAHGWTGIEWEELPRLARSTWNQHADRLAAHLAQQAGVPQQLVNVAEEMAMPQAGGTVWLAGQNTIPEPVSRTPRCPKCGSVELEMHYLDTYAQMRCTKCGAQYDCEFPADFARLFGDS